MTVRVTAILCVGLVCAVSAADADASWEARRAEARNRPRCLILNADGSEISYWPTNAPLTPAGFTSQRLVDYLGTAISTVSYCPRTSGFGLMTTTRAGEFFDVPYYHRAHPGCVNGAPLLAAKGLDCLDMTVDFCHTNNFEVFVSVRVNDTHDRTPVRPGVKPKTGGAFPKWKGANPDCLFGTKDGKAPPFGSWTSVDFENPKTRAYMKKFIGDLVNNYDVDGIEYDFMRHGPILKTVGWGAYATEAQLKMMTDFMKELRSITEAAGRRRGRPILVMVRTMDSPAYAKALGIDIEAWLAAGVMDIWSASDYFQQEFWKPNADLAHRHGVLFYAALAESRVPGGSRKRAGKTVRILPGRNTPACYAAEYSAATAAGCDGIESFNLSVLTKKERDGLLRVDPRKTAHLDKVYFALTRGSGGYKPESWLRDGGKFYRRPRIDPGAPLRVPTDRPYVFGMEIGDDPAAGGRAVAKAIVGGDAAAIRTLRINGRVVPRADFRNGVHAYPLSAGDWKRGYNEISVEFESSEKKRLTFHDFAIYITNSKGHVR